MDSPLLVAQLTDTHVLAARSRAESGADHNRRLAEAVAQIDAEQPPIDAVVMTGDLANDGRPGEYEALAALLEPLAGRVLPIPGNHDDRDLVKATFPAVPWADADHASWVTLLGERLRLIGLDSTMPGRPGAQFDAGREAWLRSTLAAAHDGPTVLAIHHPPFVTGIGWMDRSGFAGLDRLAAVLADHPVDRVVAGHLHRPMMSSIAGIPAQVGVSTVEHVALDLAPDAGVSLVHDPVGYQIHRISRADIVTHTRYIDGTQTPYRPSWAADYE